ncbi:MAG: hypothetical protein J6X10_07135 [Bacteroidales bacterium]|nr:hypothetical protein [Bacteroidales bacterium]
MTLICDCGATKAEWVVLDGNNVAQRFITNGFNPNFTENATMNGIIEEVKNSIDNQDVNEIFFYGSGCGGDANQVRVKMIFNKVFPNSKSEIYPDTLAACHALFGRNAGVACILGTGSNACFYDGEIITKSVASLGFMIGDEGSGCHIGKRIVHDYFLGLMPDDLRKKFDEKYHLNRESFLKKVYQGEQPSKYLAEFSKFASENNDDQYVKSLVNNCFEAFISSFRLEQSGMEKSQTVAFVGSIAFAFQEILTQVLDNHHIKCEKIMKNPMDGLIEYYQGVIA